MLNNRKTNQLDAKRQQELLAKLRVDTLETHHVSAYLSAQEVAPKYDHFNSLWRKRMCSLSCMHLIYSLIYYFLLAGAIFHIAGRFLDQLVFLSC